MPIIEKFTGLNNSSPARDARDGDLQVADNVILTDGGSIKRRMGKVVLSGLATHSLFSDGDALYYVQGGSLVRNDVSPTQIASLSDGSSSMGYMSLNGQLYYSNGTDSGIVLNGVATPWGVTPPGQPTLEDADGFGDPGDYLVSITYLLDDGQESAASQTVAITVANGGITVSDIDTSTDPRVIGVNIYVSGPNGEAGDNGEGLHRAATITNGAGSVGIADLPATGDRCVTLNTLPMPAGQILCFHAGRVWVASGSYLFYSMPWNYGLIDLSRGFLPFQENITSLIPLENGLAVGTTKRTVFLAGRDPLADGGMVIKNIQLGACITGSVLADRTTIESRTLSPGAYGLAVTENGIIAIDNTGQIEHITKDYWAPTSVTASPTGTIWPVSNETQYLFVDGTDGYAMNIATKGVTKFMSGVNSFAYNEGDLFVGGPTGLWVITGDDDNGTPITATITKEGLDFKSNKLKRIPIVVLHMRSDGNMSATISNGTDSSTVSHEDGIETMHGSKIKMARGVWGRNLSFSYTNVDGSFFEIAELELEAEISKIRRERQTG